MGLKSITSFFNVNLPKELEVKYSNSEVLYSVGSGEMSKYIDFQLPFLKTEKIVILNSLKGDINKTSSLGIGKVYPEQMNGHYNSTIYLAYAGFLMASTASVHAGILYPDTAPQAYEGASVSLIPGEKILNNGILKPRKEGTTFYVETVLKRKIMKLLIAETYVYFGSVAYGRIKDLKIMLTEKNSIWTAIDVPEV